jgi:hypothetical protein
MTKTESTKGMIEHVRQECSEVDIEKQYDEMLDEIYSFKRVGGPFEYMQPSRVLRDSSPTDYRVGFSDWLAAESDRIVDIDGNYYDREEVEREAENYIDGLRAEIADGEILSSKVCDIEAAIQDCEKHAWQK